ncbi:MAG: hypothetical protein HY670_11445 [Chloroflexi bacterium]|nr:hypothetical protein [Chloroflexota bacterium]
MTTLTVYGGVNEIGGKYPGIWMRHLFQECAHNTVLASDVHSAQDSFILCFSFFDLNELPSIAPDSGGLYLYSSSEPHDEEQEIAALPTVDIKIRQVPDIETPATMKDSPQA